MEYFKIFISSLVSIVFLFFICKIMGRKQISQLNFFDYVIGITIGSIASIVAVSDSYKILLYGLISMSFYALFDVFISTLILKFDKLKKVIIGEEIIIIKNNKIMYDNMKKLKLDLSTLLSEARINGYFDLSKIKYAFMEINGRISFLPNDEVYYRVLIADGVINYNILNELNLSEEYLIKKYKKIDDILLLFINESNEFKVYKKY